MAAARPIIEVRLEASRTALAALGAEHLPTDLVSIDEHGFEALTFDAKRALFGLYVARIAIAKATGKRGARFDPARVYIVWRA